MLYPIYNSSPKSMHSRSSIIQFMIVATCLTVDTAQVLMILMVLS